MKKIMTILAIILFAFTCVGGSVFYLADIPAAVQEEKNKENYDENEETNTTASGYWSSYYASSFAGGTGESDKPYLIETAEQLARMAYLINGSSSSSYNTKYYQLTADIDLAAHYWVPIANTSSLEFRGSFFGGYHVIKNMTCYMASATDSYYSVGCALFGNAKQNAEIYSFSMTGISITTASVAFDTSKYYKFAGVVAQLSCDSGSCMLFNVNIFGTIQSSFSGSPYELLMGGAVGYAQNAGISGIQSYVTIRDSSSSSSSSTRNAYCGGVVGWAASGCSLYGTAMLGYIDFYGLGTNSGGGGLVGQLSGGAEIKESYAVYGTNPGGSFWLSRYAGGGLVGRVNNGKIISSWSYLGIYLNSSSFSTKYKGGLVGYASSLTFYCVALYSSTSIGYTYSVGNNSFSGSGASWLSAASFRRSSTFNSYMQNDSYSESQKWWYGSPWNYDSDSYNHLNYGFPVLKAMCAQAYVQGNSYLKTYGVKTTGTGVDTSYTAGGNDGTQSGIYFLIGGSLTVNTTGESGSYFRYLSRRAKDLMKVSSDTGSLTTKSATVSDCAGDYSYVHGYTYNNINFYAFYSPPASKYWQSNYASSFAGGSGTSSSPYLISNGAQLARLAYLSNSASDYSTYNSLYYKLTDDIDISDRIWTPIGLKYNFTGNFNGNGFTIKGLWCQIFSDDDPVYTNTSSAVNSMGLFGGVYGGGYVSNFVLVDVDIGGDETYQNMIVAPKYSMRTGAVSAHLASTNSTVATISQVGVFGSINIKFWNYIGYVGGIVGFVNGNILLEKSFNYASVRSECQYGSTYSGYTGGIAGEVYGSSSSTPIIDNCYNAGHVYGEGVYTGGLVGESYSGTYKANYRRCYNIGYVTGFYYKGGLFGCINGSGGTVNNCFTDANISSVYKFDRYSNYKSFDYKGSFVGYNNNGTIDYCGYNSSKCSAEIYSGSSTNIYTTFSFTQSSIVQNFGFGVFKGGPYTWSRASGLSTSSSSTWQFPSSVSNLYLNNGYAVLQWSLRLRDVTANFSQCGTATIALTGSGATSGEAQSYNRYGILGMGIKIFTTPTAGSYGDYTGIYETKSNGSTKVKISEDPTYYEFTPDSTYDNIRVLLNANSKQSGISFYTSGFTAGTTYRVYFVDNNQYGTSGASCYIKNICFKQLSYGSWSTMSLPEIRNTYEGSFVNKTYNSTDWQANAISGNTYSGMVVQLWNDGTFVRNLSSPNIEYNSSSVKAKKSFVFTYNSSSHNRIRIGLNGNQADATFWVSASILSSGSTYRIVFVDNTTTYGTAGKGGSLSDIKLQWQNGSTWIDMPIPDPSAPSNGTVTRVDGYTLRFSANGVSGNTYDYSKVQLWKTDTFVSEISATTVSATTQYYWKTFIKGSGYYGNAYSYYAVYTARPVTFNVRVVAYTPFDSSVNLPSSYSTVGSFGYSCYTTGNPIITTKTSGSSLYNSTVPSYVYRPLTLTSAVSNSSWQFRGWYSSTSSTITASACSGTALSTSSSYSITPSDNTTKYYFAVFQPKQETISFAGTYTSEDDGATYSRKTSSSGYPYATLKYVKPTYSAIIGSTTTSQNSSTASPTSITYTINKTYTLSITSNGNYTFVGWYYGDTPTLLSESTTYSASGTIPTGIHARFKRKVVNYDVYIMTDEGTGTYVNSANGGNPTWDYYNRTNNYTHTALTTTNHFEIQAGTNISIGYSNDYYAKPGYKFMGVSTNATVPTYTGSGNGLNIRSLTAGNSTTSAYKIYFFYKKTAANKLKRATENLAKISNVSVSTISGYNFVINNNGFYESQNFGYNNSYSLAKVSFTLASAADITFDYISYGESSCDYGVFSNIDTTLSSSYTADSTNVKLSTIGQYNDGKLRQLVYKNVSAGNHYVYVKYRKDGSVHYGYDSLQFRLVTEYSKTSYWYFEDGEYPQSYVGDAMNNTLIANASLIGYLDYNNGKADITKTSNSSENIIKVYSYSGKKYAAMKAPKTQTLTMNDGYSYTFTGGNLYFFAFEPIRWRVNGEEPLTHDEVQMTGSTYYTLSKDLKYEDKISVNIWAYMDNWSEYAAQNMVMLSCTESGGFNIETSEDSNQYICYTAYDKGVGYKHANMLGKRWVDLSPGWHLFSFTFDGNCITGYVDGSMQGPTSDTFTSKKIGYNNNNTIFVGAEASDNATTPDESRKFIGKVDRNIKIVNYAMTSTEINNLYKEYDLKSFWEFGERRTGFDVVSQNVLGFGAVNSDLTDVTEDWKFEESNMYKNVSKSNSSTSSTGVADSSFKYKQSSDTVLYSKTLNWGSTPSNSGDIYDYIKIANLTEGEKFVLNVSVESGTITASGYPALVLDIVKGDKSGLTTRNNAEIYFKTGTTNYSATMTVKAGTVNEGSLLKVWFWKDSTYTLTCENVVLKIEVKRISAHDYQYFAPTSAGQDKVKSYVLLEENIRVASMKELEYNLNDLRANASDMVAFFMGVDADKYCEYWTRDLGVYLKNGYTITSNGQKKTAWLNRVSGIRFSITFAEGWNEF